MFGNSFVILLASKRNYGSQSHFKATEVTNVTKIRGLPYFTIVEVSNIENVYEQAIRVRL